MASKNSCIHKLYNLSEIHTRFTRAVNMTADEIRDWLKTPQSKSVGQIRPGESESIGRQSARKIIAILEKDETKLTAADYSHMKRVCSYVARHTAQEPRDILTSRWRYSLMNWGHDPVKRRLAG